MQELTINLRKETNFICMVTEPSVIRHRLSGIPKHYNSIPAQKDNSPRAAIFTSPTIPIQEVSNLSHRDLAVGLIKCGGKQTAIWISNLSQLRISFKLLLNIAKPKGIASFSLQIQTVIANSGGMKLTLGEENGKT